MTGAAILTVEEWDALRLSLQVASFCVVLSLPAAIVCAWLLARKAFPGKLLLDAVLHLPLVLPPVVTGYFLLFMFGRNGLFGSVLYRLSGFHFIFDWRGAVLASAIVSFPLMLRQIRLAIEHVDTRTEAMARTLGASPLRVFMRITLPLAMPGIVSGCFLSFARSLGEFGATISFVGNIQGKTQTLPLAIYNAMQNPETESAAFRLVMISVALAFCALFASEYLARKTRSPRSAK